ncbi:MAG TPA: alpha/beta hydrolase [Saprospiraceae bacterium]|nr:alpha/beta hydrolase [Saprospiraceae bacterium]
MLYYKIYDHPTSTEWVTFIHGAGGSSSVWYRQIRDFKESFNILLIDLRGHGRSKMNLSSIKNYTFEVISKDVLEVLNHLNIYSSHFVGISLGTLIIRELAQLNSNVVKTMILGGAVMKLNVKSQILMRMGMVLKSVLPYMVLYKIYAWIIIPNHKYRESRYLFIREAKKLYQKEFLRWFKLTAQINKVLKIFREEMSGIPALYIMGSEDHMFLPSVKVVVQHHTYATLHIISQSGHVVNIDRPEEFNSVSIQFIKDHYSS